MISKDSVPVAEWINHPSVPLGGHAQKNKATRQHTAFWKILGKHMMETPSVDGLWTQGLFGQSEHLTRGFWNKKKTAEGQQKSMNNMSLHTKCI